MKENLFYMPVKIGNVELRNPFIVASGPTAKRVDQLELAEKSGWGAASLKQTFNPFPYINYEPRYRWLKRKSSMSSPPNSGWTWKAASASWKKDGRSARNSS